MLGIQVQIRSTLNFLTFAQFPAPLLHTDSKSLWSCEVLGPGTDACLSLFNGLTLGSAIKKTKISNEAQNTVAGVLMCLRGPRGSSAPARLQAQPVLLPGALRRSVRPAEEPVSEPQSAGSPRALSPGLESRHFVEVVLLVLLGWGWGSYSVLRS